MRLTTLILGLMLSIMAQANTSPLKVAFVYVSTVGDAGWSRSHEDARVYLEKTFGKNIETTFVENVPVGKEARKVFDRLAQEGQDVIFATSYGYMVSSQRVASMYPNVKFEHATGLRRGDNLSTYGTRAYEARYLSGIVAGRMTNSDKIGYVAAYPIPEIIRGINAFTLGVRSVNPDAEVEVKWTKSWYNPTKAAKLTHQLIDDGADIITQHTDSPEPVKVANERGVYAIGYHSDMSEFGPKTHLMSVTHNWGKIYAKRIEAMQDESWKSSDLWMGLKEGTSGLTSISRIIPNAVMKEVNTAKQQIIAGNRNIFAGPIKNNRGRMRVRENNRLTDDELQRLNWYVEGTTGDLRIY